MFDFIKWIAVAVISGLALSSSTAQVVINEVMSANVDFIYDEDGNDSDWLELYNPGLSSVCLEGWALSDDNALEKLWHFPDLCIPPQGFLFVWASGKNRSSPLDSLHTNFKLSAFGEDLLLINDIGVVIDSISLPLLEPNESFGYAGNIVNPVVFLNPSPGLPNDTNSIKLLTTFKFESSSRILEDELMVSVSKDGNCTEWMQNLRGVPYSGVLLDLNNDTNDVLIELDERPPYFSIIPTTKDFRLPRSVDKMAHLSVSCLMDGVQLGTLSQTYFDRPHLDRHELPVVNLDLESQNLFDSRIGILVEGEDGNFRNEGRKWERQGEACLYLKDQLFCDKFGVRVHGHATRELPQKSLKLYYRNSIDSSIIDRDLIYGENGTLNRFVLRSFHSDHIGNEFTDFGFRDDVIMSIIKNDNQVYAQSSRPIVGYINGEYWGLFSLHDASDDDFIASKTGLHPDRIELFSGPDALLHQSNDVAGLDLDLPSERALFESYFNLDNLVDYLIFQMFFLNTDWPHNNVKFWKEKDSQGPHFFILFDMDATMKSVRQNYFSRFYSGLGLSQRLDPAHNRFWQQLFSSSYFIDRLRLRYAELRKSILSPDQMLSKIDNWKESIDSEMERHIDRWHYPRSKKTWLKSFEEIREFVAFRDLYFSKHMEQLVGAVIYPNPAYGRELHIREEFSNIYTQAKIYSLSGQPLGTVPIRNASIDLKGLEITNQCLIIDLVGADNVRTEKVVWRQ